MTRPPGCDISVRRPLTGQTVASVVVYNRGAPRPCSGQRSSQESECQQSIICEQCFCAAGPCARALGDTDRAQQPPGPERLQFPPRSRFPPRTRSYLRLYLRACVRHTSTPPVSRLSALAGIARLPVCLPSRARVFTSSLCFCSMCDSVCGEIATKSSSGVPKVSKNQCTAVRRVSLLLLSRLPRRRQRTSADVDYHLTVLVPSI